MKLDPPISIKLDDDKAERSRRDLAEKLLKVQQQQLVQADIIADVELANAKTIPVPHKLGKRPTFVTMGIPRGAAAAGYVVEVSRDATYIKLQANGYGATITVDLAVT